MEGLGDEGLRMRSLIGVKGLGRILRSRNSILVEEKWRFDTDSIKNLQYLRLRGGEYRLEECWEGKIESVGTCCLSIIDYEISNNFIRAYNL
jgi:hypothetical protein